MINVCIAMGIQVLSFPHHKILLFLTNFSVLTSCLKEKENAQLHYYFSFDFLLPRLRFLKLIFLQNLNFYQVFFLGNRVLEISNQRSVFFVLTKSEVNIWTLSFTRKSKKFKNQSFSFSWITEMFVWNNWDQLRVWVSQRVLLCHCDWWSQWLQRELCWLWIKNQWFQ